MSFKKWWAFALSSAFVGTLAAAGCSSSSSNPSNPTDGGSDTGIIHKDSGPSGDDSSVGDDSGGGTDGGSCPITGYKAMPWAPPSMWGQGACTQTQLGNFVTNCIQGTTMANVNACNMMLQDMAAQNCLNCLLSDLSGDTDAALPTSLGPVLVEKDPSNPMYIVLVPNFGGCQAHFDNMSGKGSCGNTEQDANMCIDLDCGSCSSQAAFKGCAMQVAAGECKTYIDASKSCDAELQDGGVAAMCNDATNFIAPWCGGGDGGISDAGGGG